MKEGRKAVPFLFAIRYKVRMILTCVPFRFAFRSALMVHFGPCRVGMVSRAVPCRAVPEIEPRARLKSVFGTDFWAGRYGAGPPLCTFKWICFLYATLYIRYTFHSGCPFRPTPPWGPLSSLFFPLGGVYIGNILPPVFSVKCAFCGRMRGIWAPLRPRSFCILYTIRNEHCCNALVSRRLRHFSMEIYFRFFLVFFE